MDDNKRDIIHIKVGTPDWEPTSADIERVTQMFDEALDVEDEEDTALVITKSGIELTLERVEEGEELRLFVISIRRTDEKKEQIAAEDEEEESEYEFKGELTSEDMDALANAPFTRRVQ
jgi:hypothetical protein